MDDMDLRRLNGGCGGPWMMRTNFDSAVANVKLAFVRYPENSSRDSAAGPTLTDMSRKDLRLMLAQQYHAIEVFSY